MSNYSDFDIMDGVLIKYHGKDPYITIPADVTKIRRLAFSQCPFLKGVKIISLKIEIEDEAFSKCGELESFEVLSSEFELGSRVFKASAIKKLCDENGFLVIKKILVAFQNINKTDVVYVPEGVEIIKGSVFSGMFRTEGINKIVFPESLKLLRPTILSKDIDVNIPKNYFNGETPLPEEFTVELLEANWKEKVTPEIYTKILFLYTAKPYQAFCKSLTTLSEEKVVAAMLEFLENNPKTAYFEKAARYAFLNHGRIPRDMIIELNEKASKAKAKNALEMLTLLVSDGVSEATMLETRCKAEFIPKDVEKVIKKAEIDASAFKNVYYKNSKEKADEFVVKCALVPYLELMEARPKQIGGYKEDYIEVEFMPLADEIVASLDRDSFLEALEKATDLKTVTAKPQRLLPFCRFGSRVQIKNVISHINWWDDWYTYSSSGRSTIIVARGALMLSDTREAMIYMEKCKILNKYAKIRGLDEDAIRDTVLSDFGFDENGKIEYDLGNTVVEVFMANDLTLSIYDRNAGKIVKSIPKKGADPEKYEKVSAAFSDVKSNVKKVVKARNEFLFEAFFSCKEWNPSSWQASYLKNPVLTKVAELIVWKQNDNFFILSNGTPIDSFGNVYTINDSEKISVAHPMVMEAAEVKRWQHYFTENSLKQPFEQVWEPVISLENVAPDRYKGMYIPFYRFKDKEKHGITVEDHDFHNDIDINFAHLSADISRIDYQRHCIKMEHRFEITKISVLNKSRRANHIIAYLDKITIIGIILNDDVSLIKVLDSFTMAQIVEFISIAIENKCTNVIAALLEYKHNRFPNVSPMDEFVL